MLLSRVLTIQSAFWLGTQVWAWAANGQAAVRRNANATARIMAALATCTSIMLSPLPLPMRQSDYCYRMALSVSSFGNPFQRRRRNIGLGGAPDDAVVDHRARQRERRVVVGELEVAALARIERRPAVIHLLHPVHPRSEVAIGVRRPLDVVDEV